MNLHKFVNTIERGQGINIVWKIIYKSKIFKIFIAYVFTHVTVKLLNYFKVQPVT